MTRISLSVAALFIATASAFAGSDHFDPGLISQPAAAVDSSVTASIHKRVSATHRQVDTGLKTGAVAAPSTMQDPADYGQGIWGQ
ncbi:DUF680 domain-containing protein [Mesorhizobium sp. SP-1A]|uniref:DUF680 domain-containing protein n=1 Tax=Mesorhizobium sp. SP-1A TaxID=3077840 RepID=UPI0028F71C5D|nr:DUF680 domain-containing protein [Mesorhizobium sp. SP-1A]